MGNAIRAAVRAALQYAKRAALLPWRFHDHAGAAAEHRAVVLDRLADLAGLQATTADMVNAQTHTLATHLAKLMWEELPRLVDEHFRRSVSGPVEAMTTEYRTGLAVVVGEQRALNDRHASCYDRLVEQLRRQADLLATLIEGRADPADIARRLAELTAAQDELTAQVAAIRADVDRANATTTRRRAA